ncbi:MAG: cytochrome c biogenesis protein ResB [Armatimonadota bacterium]
MFKIIRTGKVNLKKLSFILIHTGILVLIFSCLYGALSPYKYAADVEVNLREKVKLSGIPFSIEFVGCDIGKMKSRIHEPGYSCSVIIFENSVPVKKGNIMFNSPLKYYGYNFYLAGWEASKKRCYINLLVRYIPEYPFILLSYFIIGTGLLINLTAKQRKE